MSVRRWTIFNRAGGRSRGWSPWMLQRPGSTLGSWYRMENAAGRDNGPAQIHLYDEIGMWGISAQDFVNDLKGVRAGAIELHINSPGGEVYDGLAIYNTLKNHRAHVTVYIDGLAASAASFIAMAGDHIVIARNADMMIHDAMGVCFGNAADMVKLAERLAGCSDNIADIYSQRSGVPVTEWRDRMRANDGEGTWYTGQGAVDAGLADEVSGEASPEDRERASNHTTQLGLFAMNRPAAAAPAVPVPTPRGATGDLDPGLGAPGESEVPPSSDSPALAPVANVMPPVAGWLAEALAPAPPAVVVPARDTINLGEIVSLTLQSALTAPAPAEDSPPEVAPEPTRPDGLLLADALREGLHR